MNKDGSLAGTKESTPTMNKNLKNILEFAGFKLFKAIFLPFPNFAQKFFLTRIMILAKIRKKIVVKQLKMVFPDKTDAEINSLCNKIYHNLGLLAYEVFFANPDKLLENFEIDGLENLQYSQSQHRGVLYPNMHIGNWEIGMRYMTKVMGCKVNGLAKRMRNPYLDKYVENIRLANGVPSIFLETAFKDVLKAIKNDEGIGIMVDQNARKVGLQQNWLGHPASVFQGPAKFAIKSGAMLQPTICVRTEKGFKIIAEKPFDGRDYTKEKIPELTEKINKSLEKYILQYPEQWFWMHKRW